MTKEQKRREEIAEITGIPLNQVILAILSPFEFTKKEIESGNRRPIRHWKLGLFNCKPKRVEKLKEKGLLND